MEDTKIAEIKQHIIDTYNYWRYPEDLAQDLKLKYVFGPYGDNENYLISDIWGIVLEVQQEKNPSIVEPIEPVDPIIDPPNQTPTE